MSRKPAVFDQLNIVSQDMDASLDFYRRLGLEIPDTLPDWQAHHRTVSDTGELDVDLDSTAFARQWCEGWSETGTGLVLGFRLATREDVDALYAELTDAGYEGLQPPYDAFWGARYAVVEDPAGNAVGLMSPPDPKRRTAPPTPPA